MHRPRSVREADVTGRRVLVRADFNVPLDAGEVADDTRIRAALPTIRLLDERGASSVVLCSHLGRPKGEPDARYSLRPVAARLARLLGREVAFDNAAGPLVLLENTRFHPGETANDPRYAAELAAHGDVFVNDAFGSAHRAHASTEGVARLLPAYAGLLLERELQELSRLVEAPEQPLVVIVGGAKVDDKIGVLRRLADRADALLIGGKMAEDVRADDKLQRELRQRAELLLPTDVIAAAAFAGDAAATTAPADAIPPGWLGLDIGPETRARYAARIAQGSTVFWNGPMGVFEWPRFSEGTLAVAHAVADCDGFTVVGGGDSVRAIEEAGLAERIDWVSTGGGASLEYLEGRQLPGVAAIPAA